MQPCNTSVAFLPNIVYSLLLSLIYLFLAVSCCSEIAQYLRSRKHLGVNRSVDYFEFARAFAAIR